ncbi:hypothetical protein PIB30_100644 [Stylosanthes scabra]|uniref:Uncharacterized protein n=1 Tax=Stylosanthes scabra TaxID=79078 RepID=A0ABU6WX63_9FABA|nr:hypothetical protein [Stylosanthes scabra]
MTRTATYFIKLNDYDGGFVTFGDDDKGKIITIGKVAKKGHFQLVLFWSGPISPLSKPFLSIFVMAGIPIPATPNKASIPAGAMRSGDINRMNSQPRWT